DLRDGDVAAQSAVAQAGGLLGLVLRGRGAHDLRDRARIGAEARDHDAAGRHRLAERDQRGGLVVAGTAGGVRDADDGAEDEPGDGQPPVADDGPAPACKIDLALLEAVGAGGRHAEPTLADAHSHWARTPSSSETRGSPP